MERKDCFGSIQEIILENGLTVTNAKPECRGCEEVRDCLRYAKQAIEEKREGDELKKQNMIAQIIDISQIISNEIGSCLLEFLNRIYSSPLGSVLFRNFLLFYEIPKDILSLTLNIPISSSTLNLIRGEEVKVEHPAGQTGVHQRKVLGEGEFSLRIVLIQRSFPNNRKANMGLIAHEVARLFSSDRDGILQILQTLKDPEISLFKKMDDEQRIAWLMKKWGFLEELEALRKEISLLEGKRR
ncbi:MAG: hypothetical protein AB1502_14045 [Thermodesulfobacteriota bacterium]